MKKYYIIVNETMILNLEPRTYQDCQKSIAWQNYPTPSFSTFNIATYDRGQKAFVDVKNEDIVYTPIREPYTLAAWTKFLELLNDL